jgi:two-component sensor histidine kinase
VERNPTLRRVFLARISPVAAAGWAVVAVVVPTALRWAIDRGEGGMAFLTFYPAVVLSALFLGWRWATAVAVVSAVIANRVLRPHPLLFYEGPREALLVALFLLSCAALVWIGSTARRLVRELEAAKVREETLNHELLHRVKNMLATVNAVAVLTARHTPPDEFVRALDGRMRALERATGLLGTSQKGQCDLHRLIADALEPFAGDDAFTVEGPGCELPRDSCVPLALALHELCTNAAKHGALRGAAGRVDLRWTIGEGAGADGARLLRLVWRESGGPPVVPPAKTGMGARLLRAQRGLDEVLVAYPPDGLMCEINVAGVGPPVPLKGAARARG